MMADETKDSTTTAATAVDHPGDKPLRNNVKRLREQRLLSKAELARKAGLSALTIDRVEAGMTCRMDTKRKIILALGMTVEDKDKVWPEGEGEGNA